MKRAAPIRTAPALSAAILLACLLLNGPAEAAPNPPDHAVLFQGDGRREVVRIRSHQPIQAPYTLEFWTALSTNAPGLIGLIANESDQGGILLSVENGTTLGVALGSGNGWHTFDNVGIPSIAGRWAHVAIAVGPTTWQLYLDGVPSGAGAIAGPPPLLTRPGMDLLPGSGGSFGESLRGRLDELRIWTTLRSGAEIAADRHRILDGTEPGLAGRWRFTEGRGTAAIGLQSSAAFDPFAEVEATWAAPGAPVGGPGTATGPAPVDAIGLLTGTFESTVPARGWLEFSSSRGTSQSTVPVNFTPAGSQVFTVTLPTNLPAGTWSFRAVGSNQFGVNAGLTRYFTSQFPQSESSPAPGAGFPLTGDFNGDLYPDLLISLTGGSLALGQAGGFGPAEATGIGLFATVGDLDGDGRSDVLSLSNPVEQRLQVARWSTNDQLEYVNLENPGILGTMVIADFDGDGRPDIMTAGGRFVLGGLGGPTLTPSTQLLLNRGGLKFHEITNPVAPVDFSFAGSLEIRSLAAGDVDGDGLPDVLIFGQRGTPTTNYCGIWHNLGGGRFEETGGLPLGPTAVLDAIIRDYDGDGLGDVLLVTNPGGSIRSLFLFHNDGDGEFTIRQQWFGEAYQLPAWSDFDNDGDPDLFLNHSGAGGIPRASLWLNERGRFVPLPSAVDAETNLIEGAWADLDLDGDWDLIATGPLHPGRIFRNQAAVPNTPPSAPGPLVMGFSNGVVQLHWAPATDAESAANWLTYNLRLGTSPGAADIVAPTARTTGNRGLNRHHAFTPVPGRTYFASVQAVDSQFVAGAWSPEVRFRFDLVQTDGTETRVPGDTNGDGVVSLEELNAVIQAYRGFRR